MTLTASRVLEGYGLVEVAWERCVRGLPLRVGETSRLVVDALVGDHHTALEFLSRLTFPATRHVAFPAGPQWTVLVNNSRNGSDFADYAWHFARHFRRRAIRVVDTPSRVWRRGGLSSVLTWEARILDVRGPSAESVKSIS